MPALWERWEVWFAAVQESQTSYAALNFFRSPRSDQSWIVAAGTVLDAAALTLSAVDVPRQPHAAMCIRAGYVALRRIADFFGIAYDPDPRPDDLFSSAEKNSTMLATGWRRPGFPCLPAVNRRGATSQAGGSITTPSCSLSPT